MARSPQCRGVRHGAWGAWPRGTWAMGPGTCSLGWVLGTGLAREPCNQSGGWQGAHRLLWDLLGAAPAWVWWILVTGSTIPPPIEKCCTGHNSLGGRGDVPLTESPGDNLQSPGLVLICIQTPWIKTSIICSQGLAGTAWPGRLRGRRAGQSWGWSRANKPASALAQAAGSAAAEVSLAA